jgi:hypothetical protein
MSRNNGADAAIAQVHLTFDIDVAAVQPRVFTEVIAYL